MLLAVPGLLIQSVIPASAAGKDLFDVSAARILPLSIGLYLCLAALVPFLLYLGNWMLQRARAGKRMAFFSGGKGEKIFLVYFNPDFPSSVGRYPCPAVGSAGNYGIILKN